MTTCKDSSNEGKTEVEESLLRLANESVRARKGEKCPPRRRKVRLPNGGHGPHWAKGLWALGGSIVSAVVGHRAGIQPTHVMERGCGQTRGRRGVRVPALQLHSFWEGPRKKGQGF